MDSLKHSREIKSFHNDVNNSTSSNLVNIQRADNLTIEVASVTICLTSNHNECNGKYIDSFSGNYIIICLCKCHDQESKKQEDNKIDRNSEIVEFQKLHNKVCNSNRKNIKPYTSILDDICYCGHKRNSHLGLNQCNEKDCKCLEFSP